VRHAIERQHAHVSAATRQDQSARLDRSDVEQVAKTAARWPRFGSGSASLRHRKTSKTLS
ncbi:MAG: hypothetical protein AAGC46_15345, partial [Solirubrobacteraceae bacterium]